MLLNIFIVAGIVGFVVIQSGRINSKNAEAKINAS